MSQQRFSVLILRSNIIINLTKQPFYALKNLQFLVHSRIDPKASALDDKQCVRLKQNHYPDEKPVLTLAPRPSQQ